MTRFPKSFSSLAAAASAQAAPNNRGPRRKVIHQAWGRSESNASTLFLCPDKRRRANLRAHLRKALAITPDPDLHNRENAAMMTQFPPVECFPDGGAVEMSSRIPVALGTKRGLNAFVFCAALLLGFVASMQAQCPLQELDPDAPPKPPSPHAADEALLPENGHLSNTTYTSDYFGFAFDLPIAAQGHLLMLPLMPERQHALLALQFENASHAGTITITAIEPRPGLEAPTPEQQQQEFNNWASSGSQPGRVLRYPVPDYMLRTTGRFYSSVRHKGENYAALYWTRIKNYNLKILVASNDQDFLRKSKHAINAAHFYCTQDDGTLTTADGKPVKPEGDPYTGPTVPTALAYEAVKAKPALESIPPGGVSGAVYRNPDLGLQYQFPKGWDVFPAEANDDPPHDAIALREHEFLHACSKTLLRIAPPGPSGAAGQLARPTITLRALDPSCLVMRIPSSLTDKNAMDNVLASLEVLSEFGEIGSDELVSISDHLFMVFHGTIASHASNDELSQRWSQVIYATLHHKVLFVWSLMAPNSADLNAMPTTGITLDGAQSIDLRASLTAKR